MALTSSVRLWFSRSRGGNLVDVAAPGVELDTIRSAMFLMVSPCSEAHQARAHCQIHQAASVMALWLLRADLFHYLAQDMGESEAVRRVNGLLPLFADDVPGAADCGKIPDNGRHERSLH
ncbi:hypothetical protein [Polaromonas sp.]|uniref:hypothetical protein n=1 Tax=Polaromonas sp. TaxID=1869339 RepID=UPI003C90A4A4